MPTKKFANMIALQMHYIANILICTHLCCMFLIITTSLQQESNLKLTDEQIKISELTIFSAYYKLYASLIKMKTKYLAISNVKNAISKFKEQDCMLSPKNTLLFPFLKSLDNNALIFKVSNI